MAHAYTPGLRVTEKTGLVKSRRLPLPGDILVKKGDKVTADTIVAKTHLPGNIRAINIANSLSVQPQDVPECMLKKEGEEVKKGEVIARGGGFFGFLKSSCKSPIDGTLESISDITGKAILREPPTPIQIDAYVDGVVVDVIEGEGVEVETYGTLIQGIFGIGGEVKGDIKVLVSSPDEVLESNLITEDCKGKIIVGGSLITSKTIYKAIDIGVHGIIAGGLNDEDLRNFLGYDLGVAITGSEEKGITLIITEGFGKMKMAQRTFDLIKRKEGQRASMNGATQIRAGVIRPEMIVPLKASEREKAKEKKEFEPQAMDIGTPIRVIREPYFGLLGTVTALPPELQILESEAKVRVLKAELENGDTVTLPRANVEMIEE